ncbi:MAG: mandelate racemase/muconate lactonizing enzyme family protein [Ferruginibacter sp.]|nr:mandelate racemase/muconate lactonizing enzyme family protein [Ferruginibacter sp.]
MLRRNFLKNALWGSTGMLAGLPLVNAHAATAIASTSVLKIIKIRYYDAPGYNKPLFNQARGIVEIETNGGIIGIGEGGSKDMIEQCAQMMIGEDPFRIEHIWQNIYRGMFYPPGREKLHALGALEMALWDIKGKAIGVPVYDLLGGATREYIECYRGGPDDLDRTTEEKTGRSVMEAGYRVYRIGPPGGTGQYRFDPGENVKKTIEKCRVVSAAVGPGNWAIDLHTRFDMQDAIKICNEIEDLGPYFVEDPVRSENPGVYKTVRQMTKVPLAVGEQFGDRWDTNELIENHLIDYTRFTLPNTGGISEFKKLASMCETHYVGMIPHATGPLSMAALVHVLGSSSPARCMYEGGALSTAAYFNEDLVDFKNGKLYLNSRPGLGVKFDPKKADFVMEITAKTKFPHPVLKAPDGSIHNW